MTVNDIFEVNHNETNFMLQRWDKSIDGYIDSWNGTQLNKCSYRDREVSFMRIVGNPYSKDGYIELQIKD